MIDLHAARWKNSIRSIRKTFVSWIAVAVVTMIGCGVYFGIFFYADSLEEKGQLLFDETNFEDFGILAAKGLTTDEIEKLKDTEGIIDAEGGFYFPDSFIDFGDKRENTVITIVSERISRPRLIEGELPALEDECALSNDEMNIHGLSVGDTIRLIPSKNVPAGLIRREEFTVTARIEHAECIRNTFDSFVFLPAAAFDIDRTYGNYTYIKVDADIPEQITALSKEYDKAVIPVRNRCREALEDIKDSGYGILTRGAKIGFTTFRTDIRIVHSLATVFVIIFMAIGAIVVFSTITIMIDNNKERLGVMKAYGFRNHEIISQFLFYGVTGVCFGMLLSIGLAAILQSIIRMVIGGLFCVNADKFSFFWRDFFVLSALEILMASLVTVVVTVINASSYSAVDLMNRNTRKKVLKKTADERESDGVFFWLILRNMKNDLPRVLTSVVIIAGSTLIMGMGITLKNSLDNMMPFSAEKINHYDMEITASSGFDEDRMRELTDYLTARQIEYTRIQMQSAIYGYGELEEYAEIVSADEDVYREYIELISPDDEKRIVPSGSDVFVEEKITERTGVSRQDEIRIYDTGYKVHNVTVSGICRNYSPRRIYLSPSQYRSVFGKDADNNTVLIRVQTPLKDEVAKDMDDMFPEFSVSYAAMLPEDLGPMSDMYHVVVYILTGLAIIMSVFVLMNLVSIFVKRRQNEIIVMAVNGFYHKEQVRYLLTETLVTTGLGLALGVIAGCLMTDPLVHVVEVEEAMFVRQLDPGAWICAVTLEAIFAVTINLFVFRNLKKLKLTDINK